MDHHDIARTTPQRDARSRRDSLLYDHTRPTPTRSASHFFIVLLGVGILRSAPARKFLKLVGIPPDSYGQSALLQEVFRGSVGSSTGIPGRGHGLPQMKRDADAGRLPGLKVMTSKTIGTIADSKFRTIAESFHGTLFRWHSD